MKARMLPISPDQVMEGAAHQSPRRLLETLSQANLAIDLSGVEAAPDAFGWSPVTDIVALQRAVFRVHRIEQEEMELGQPLGWMTGGVSNGMIGLVLFFFLIALRLLVYPLVSAAFFAFLATAALVTLGGALRHYRDRERRREGLIRERARLRAEIEVMAHALCDHSFVITRGGDILCHTPALGWLRREEEAAAFAGDSDSSLLLQAERLRIETRLASLWENPPTTWTAEGLLPDLERLQPKARPLLTPGSV